MQIVAKIPFNIFTEIFMKIQENITNIYVTNFVLPALSILKD